MVLNPTHSSLVHYYVLVVYNGLYGDLYIIIYVNKVLQYYT